MMLFVVAIVLALVAGYVASASDVRLIILGLGLIGIMVVFLNPELAVSALMVAALVVVGTAQLYAPGFTLVSWAVGGTAVVMGAYVFVDKLVSLERTGGPVSSIFVFIFLLVAMSIISAILNQTPLSVMAYGLKGYFQVLGLFFAISLLRWEPRRVNRLPMALIIIAVLQLPFVMHQWFVLVPARANLGDGIVAEDIVSGTLGATMLGGGSNAVLSLLLITAIALVAGLYKNHRMQMVPALVLIAICATPLLLNSNRAALFYLPLAYIIIFIDDVVRRPLRGLATGIAMCLLVALLVWANATLGSRSDEFDNWQELLEITVERNSAEQHGWGEYDLNRLTVLSHWGSEHASKSEIAEMLYGHGPGASREAAGRNLAAIGRDAQIVTLASSKYPSVGIGLTGISALLWEIGILGLLIVIGLFVSAYRAATYLIHRFDDFSYQKGVAEGLRAAVIILGLSLFFKNAFVFHLPFQALLFTILGYLSFWQRRELAAEMAEHEKLVLT